jgi:hypothetical protein
LGVIGLVERLVQAAQAKAHFQVELHRWIVDVLGLQPQAPRAGLLGGLFGQSLDQPSADTLAAA